jgi:hypothetical protein
VELKSHTNKIFFKLDNMNEYHQNYSNHWSCITRFIFNVIPHPEFIRDEESKLLPCDISPASIAFNTSRSKLQEINYKKICG